MADYRFSVVVDVDIANAESEAEARKAAFALLTTPETQKKGRPSSGPRGMVTGIAINSTSDKYPSKADVLELSKEGKDLSCMRGS